MRVTFDMPDSYDSAIEQKAREDGHKNKSAVIRKALHLYLFPRSSDVKKLLPHSQKQSQE